MPAHALCPAARLQEGRGWPVRLGGRRLAVFLVDGDVRVVDNECAHQASPLDGGAVDGRLLVCPWHGWCYDIDTGALQTDAGKEPGIGVYEAWVEDGTVYARVPDSDTRVGD